MDTVLFCGLLVHLAERGALDESYIALHTAGFEAAIDRAREIAPDLAPTAARSGLGEAEVLQFFELFRATEGVVTCYSQGVNQSAQGTDKVNAIINCHLATGRVGRPGTGPFSLTGQPNAMGGREVGGLANQLTAHMGFSPEGVDRVRRFWNAPNTATCEGHKAVQMFDAIACGEIKALWVMATNPAVSLPQAGKMRETLRKLELFVVSDNVVSNDTIEAGPHVLLPAAAWGEKDGTVTNSERCISRQRAFLPRPGEAQPDWWIVTQVAQRMGFGAAFPYRSAAEIFREHAALSAFENGGTRDFDLGALAELSDTQYDALAPTRWGADRFFAAGGFFTPDKKARFVAPEAPALRGETSAEFPFLLNTGRIRDQWHTMTRSGRSARLADHSSEPFVEIHPDDAERYGVKDGAFARISTAQGSCLAKVAVSDGQRRGALFMPIHWSDQTASQACVGELVAPHADPHSGQPESKATPAKIAPAEFALRGLVRAQRAPALPADTWWSRVETSNGAEYRIATNAGPMVWHDFAYRALPPDVRLAEDLDHTRNIDRAAAFFEGELELFVMVAPADVPMQELMRPPTLDPHNEIPRLLPQIGVFSETEPIVCACFSVSLSAARSAIAAGARSVEQVGEQLRAGTNCGSCLPEIRRLLTRHRASRAAAEAPLASALS
jgi:assimilatory nitrate reductase catalytic subunit